MNDTNTRSKRYSLIGLAFDKLVMRMVKVLWGYSEIVAFTKSQRDHAERIAIAHLVADFSRNHPPETLRIVKQILIHGSFENNTDLIKLIDEKIENWR